MKTIKEDENHILLIREFLKSESLEESLEKILFHEIINKKTIVNIKIIANGIPKL
tara:strand:+ start:1368 stop:1532 length:165 start_codon:yes stop_codon:yes gene_type:complete